VERAARGTDGGHTDMNAAFLALTIFQGAASAGSAPLHPFAVGESLVYSAKLGFLRIGTGNIQVAGIDTVRGIPAYNFRFVVSGGNALYRLNSVLESWTRVDNLKSLRYLQDNNENGKVRQRRFEIYPDSGFYRQEGVKDSLPTVEHPLDDAAFLFFMRTQPLEVGREYRLDYYFRKDKNPVILRVEKRQVMELPDGTRVDCLVVAPIVGDRGLFARKQDARVWITNDTRRIPVQIRTRYPFGTIILRLEKMTFAGS
jgi:hypothetical protein